MSTPNTRKFRSTTEVRCPECGKTLSRAADLQRHKDAYHPDGTEVKFPCGYAGCTYTTKQKSNLTCHQDSQHSNHRRHSCPTCAKRFKDRAACLKHRKKDHGYVPYHTNRYLAKRAERKSSKARDQGAVSDNTQNASACTATVSNLLTNATYYDEFWKELVDPAKDQSELKASGDVQVSVPVAAAPAWGASHTIRSGLSSDVGQLLPATTQTCDGTYSFGSQFDSQFGSQLDAFNYMHWPMPNSIAFGTTSNVPSSQVMGYPFPPNFMAPAAPLEPVPGPSWTPSPSLTSNSSYSTPHSQPEFFTGEPDMDFNFWYQFA